MILEACVETLEEALKAESMGASRIELCDDLNVGGITPSYALLDYVMKQLKIPIMVMIRPRGGNFVYDSSELKLMKQSIDVCKSLGVMGVVFGILDNQDLIDAENTKMLAEYADPLEITFHKAIDDTPDPVHSAEILAKIKGITRILTSGGKPTALEGADNINKMSKITAGHLKILAAGRITDKNLAEISGILKVDEFHGRKIVGKL
jgi:copper homeostasis protein